MAELLLAALHGHENPTFFLIVLIPWLLMCCLGIPLMIFWIWMIIDCATNEKSEGNEKIVWMLVVLLASWIGALIYFFARRPARKRELGR